MATLRAVWWAGHLEMPSAVWSAERTVAMWADEKETASESMWAAYLADSKEFSMADRSAPEMVARTEERMAVRMVARMVLSTA
jgi:hypothetical protein